MSANDEKVGKPKTWAESIQRSVARWRHEQEEANEKGTSCDYAVLEIPEDDSIIEKGSKNEC